MDIFSTASSVPQPQGKQVADWYRDKQPEPIEILHALAHMKAGRDDLLEALEAVTSQLEDAYEGNEDSANAYGVTEDTAKARAAIAAAKGESQ